MDTGRTHKLCQRYSNKCKRLALQQYGKQWYELKRVIGTRSVIQIRTHAQKFFIKVAKVAPPGTSLIAFVQSRPLPFFAAIGDDDFAESEEKDDSQDQADLDNEELSNNGMNERIMEEAKKGSPTNGLHVAKRKQKKRNHNIVPKDVQQLPVEPANFPANPEEMKYMQQQMPGQYYAPAAAPMLPQMDTLEDALTKTDSNLQYIIGGIQTAMNMRKGTMENNEAWANYWNYLHNTAVSLHNMVREVTNIHFGNCCMDPRRATPQAAMYPQNVVFVQEQNNVI